MPVCSTGHDPIEFKLQAGSSYAECPVCNLQSKVSNLQSKLRNLEDDQRDHQNKVDEKVREIREDVDALINEFEHAKEWVEDTDLPEATILALTKGENGTG